MFLRLFFGRLFFVCFWFLGERDLAWDVMHHYWVTYSYKVTASVVMVNRRFTETLFNLSPPVSVAISRGRNELKCRCYFN